MSLLDNKYISIYRDQDLEAFYDVEPKYRRKIIFAHLLIHLLPVLVVLAFLMPYSESILFNYALGFSFLLFAIVVTETISYLFPSTRAFYKKNLPWLMIPLFIVGGYLGYRLGYQLMGDEVFFSDEDFRLDTVLLGVAGLLGLFVWAQVGITQVLMASKALFTKKAAIEADVRFAAEIQKRILQDISYEDEYVKAYACSEPANELGGDYFEVIRKKDALFATVGDISGHSFGAGLLMTLTKSALQTHLEYNQSPSEIMTALNRLLLQQTDRSMYATMTLLKIDVNTQSAELCNAGHLPILHYQKDSGIIIQRHKKGLGLGIHSGAVYESLEFTVQKGDVLFLYSDGLVETRDAQNQVRELDYFLDIVKETMNDSYSGPDELSHKILESVQKADHAPNLEDDATLIVIEV